MDRHTATTMNPPRFEKAVVEVKELGFKPETTFFIVALRAKINRKFLWERKIDVYKKWGWSEESFVSAFLKYPWCMLASVNKIEATMNFFVDHMGWNPIVLAKHPILLLLSLEKRVIPRAFVLKFLESKGLIKDAKLAAAFKVSEDVFLKRFVTCYEEEASQLLKLYEEKKDVSNRMLKKDFKP
ncbi:putative transcription regulator mTERF family [Medicago truncatula]|uniref:Putative transcription regulator mTERF family n=1 Tax=Medicago truncatula TaxID=3880 RepID=A0A396J650_MEDTR|nr:putative transcription regulator mTERF family [Medicago truncatula]